MTGHLTATILTAALLLTANCGAPWAARNPEEMRARPIQAICAENAPESHETNANGGEYSNMGEVENEAHTQPQRITAAKGAASGAETAENAEDEALELLAKTVWGEARGCSRTEQAAVIWCILNRVDSESAWFPDSIREVVTQPHQFAGYSPDFPAEDTLVELARDVLERWAREKDGETDVGRVLPREYLFFTGDGRENHFTTEWNAGEEWGWTLQSPYGE